MDKKIVKLTEGDIHRIVSSSVKKILEAQNFGEISLDSKENIKIEFIGRDQIRKLGDVLWDMLVLSYENIGGLKTYRSKEHFLSMAKYAKIAYDNGNIVACAIYRNMEGSYKMVAIGCNQEANGKDGLQEIIKDDIEKIDFHFWAEVSGAIEHYFKKYNGYPMPNTLASKILNVTDDAIRLSSKDMVHYQRVIADEWFEKMIFGVKNDEVYKEALLAVDDYSKFMREVNKINESADNGLKYSLKQAIYIIENILRAHEEDGFNELVPSWYEALNESLKTLKAAKPNRIVDDYIEYCEYLLTHMPVLELHVLSI